MDTPAPPCTDVTHKGVRCGKPSKFFTGNGHTLCKMHAARWNARLIRHISAGSAPVGHRAKPL